nr:hypothetical protein GCM10020093_049390 [Planobispora longispora]
MEPHRDYLSRLADIDAKVERARVDPEVVLGRAAGLLAGRTGCRVDEAHAHLLRLAAERGDDPGRPPPTCWRPWRTVRRRNRIGWAP